MRLIGNEPRKISKFYIAEDLRDFLKELSDDMDLSISQIVENATIEIYRKDYEEFISRKEK